MSDHFTDTDKAFYKDGYKLAQSAFQNGFSKEKLNETIKILYEQIDSLIDSFIEYSAKNDVKIDCFKGCDWCCLQTVYGVSHELEYLYKHIKENFSETKIDAILNKAKIKNNQIIKLEEEEKINFKAPCPILHNGVCSAYEARPMACRIYLSTKVISCMEFYKNPTNPTNFPNLLDFPLKAGKMMNQGFVAVLKENGYNSSEMRIEEGLLDIFK